MEVRKKKLETREPNYFDDDEEQNINLMCQGIQFFDRSIIKYKAIAFEVEIQFC